MANRDEDWKREALALAEALRREGIRDERVLEAIASVPRHVFVPPELRDRAYDDCALPIGRGQTISQPFVVAHMTELLQVEPGHKVLEVGTGSGYQAACLAALGAEVYSLEIIEPLAQRAARALDAAGFADRVHVKIGDGWSGWPDHAPYDRVIVTAAGKEVPQALFEQLETGGRLVAPIDEGWWSQWVWLFKKTVDGSIERVRTIPVRFVPLTGGAAGGCA